MVALSPLKVGMLTTLLVCSVIGVNLHLVGIIP
jgi:hypothetical protein